jgi:hypothetical protein
MKKNVKEACELYEKMLIEAGAYSGNTEKDLKIFSASMLGNDLLQNYFKIKFGITKSNIFSASEFGSIYQLGVDSAVENASEEYKIFKNKTRLEYKLENGWIISGEIDQLCDEKCVIFDNKVTYTTSIKKTKKEGKDGQYALQMAVYKLLLKKSYKTKCKEYVSVLPMIDKYYSNFKEMETNQLNFVEIDTYSIEEIEDKLIERTNKLQEYLDLGTEPNECANLFLYKPKKTGRKALRMRCLHYCGYKDVCKYYQKANYNNNQFINSLM